ncbi:MAG: hypothetical protein IJO88_01085 [Oscillospiraceae bacterium]|nr:hypothetical protein [Oscillospiraceae bacterium]
MAKQLRWLRLDNAAKIYPAARRREWSNLFRVSVTLTEPVDKAVLQAALDVTAKRFPSLCARLRKGLFWYYLQELPEAPGLSEEYGAPLMPMGKEEVRKSAFRVIAYDCRIAVEVFHSLTDGNGALVFLKTLTAEYLRQKYGVSIPCTHGILDCAEAPAAEELEDSFLKYAGPVPADRRERTAWHLSGTPDRQRLVCLTLDTAALLEKAHTYGVTATAFLCAALMDALQRLQKEQVSDRRRRKPLKVLIPVNLRKLFPSRTLRNFALYTTPEILPRLGDYTLDEICKLVSHHMASEITPKQMGMKIAVNVGSERALAVKLLPLFIKNAVMKAVFDTVGERKSCLTLSNLGLVVLPEEMAGFVTRMDFILGVQAAAPHNCGVISYGEKTCINIIRNIRESRLEYHFFRVLQEQGLVCEAQSD